MTTIFEVSRGGLHDLEVISELGRGAETVVYLVRRRGREYALKLLTTAGNDPRALMALRREAALLGSVDYPLLPRIFEVGAAEAGPYLVLEYVDGCPLSQTLQEGPLDEARAVRLAIDVVGPLTAAHGAGLVHRDVKPDNIILGPDGTARLIDFGLIFRGGAEHDGVAGTLLYGAPEQAGMLKRAVDGRSDLYALGAVLFECVTGHPPYRSLDAGELIRMHATAPVPDPQAIRPDLSPTFTAVITKLMAKDPDDRYQSGESLLDDLHRLAAHPGAVFPVGTAGPPARTEPLVGRDAEVVQLASRWLKARDGHGGTALVEGVAGVGKSRLVRELTTAIAADGDIVLYGKCLPDDPVPLAPLRAAVERCLRVVDRLPPQERANAVERLRRAAGRGGPLLGALSPLLADLVQAPDLSGMDRHEQFVNAVAAFLIGLADEFQGALLYLDDVQWLDGLTREVLRQVTSRLPGTPLLVIATGRDDPDSTAAVGRFMNDMDATLDTRLRLGPLSREAVADLVAFHLGGLRVAPSVVDELVARIGGNPFTVVEYVRAVIDAGLIVPSWEGWRLDQAGLDRLELSDDVLDLVLQRIDGLGGETRRLLAAGAATGRRFGAALVAAICDVDPRHGQYVLAEAEARRLVTATGPDGYRFLHDRIREALLAGLDELTLRRLHQRIAEVLEATGRGEPSYVYATARHYALGETHRTPRKVYASGLAAGRLALAEHAPAEARQFLLVAVTAAQAARLTPDIGLPIALGQACARTGRFAEGLEHLDRALRAEPDRLRRAEVYGQIAEVHSSAWDPGRAFGAVRLGLAELGKPLPGNHLVLVVTTLWCVLAGLAVGLTGIGSGSARDRTRERLRLHAALLDAGARASSMQMHREMRAILGLRALYAVNRLGPAPEYVHHFAGYGLMADVARRPALAARMYARADAAAAALGDPVLVGYVAWKRGAGAHLADSEEAETWIRTLTEHERWLDLGDYLTGVSAVCIQLFKRGRTHEAYAWYARGTARLAPGAQAEGAPIAAAAALIAAQRGRRDEATAALDSMSRSLAANPDNRMQLINLLAARVIVLVELGELGQAFERGTAEFAALGIRPRHLVPEQRVYYIHQALGRLAQCRTAGREHREASLRAAEQAVAMLGEAANNRVLRAFHAAARADLEVLTGRPLDALRTAVPAELDLMPLDAPLISFELARVRARALRALGEAGQAQAHARYALLLAVDQQWDLRARSIRGEFGISGVGSLHTTGAPPLTTVTDPPSVSRSPGALNGGGGGDDRANPSSNGAALSRRLAALQQVSLAAATVLDPRELARVALDETVRILGAERAYLFLVDPDLDQLVPHLGRDGDGNDIDELTGYSSTLVERVRQTGEALVVTGSEEGVALGSRSAQVHGLRSIMIAPLLFDGRMRGVVYLDSRVAKGMFTSDDVDILTAVTNHVAVSLETARAAQLAAAVQAARRERDVAETLRAAMAEQSATLDPDEVMRRLLGALCRALTADAAVLLSLAGDRLVVTAAHGVAVAVGTDLAPVPLVLADLPGPRVGAVSEGQSPPFGALLGPARCWLALPATERGAPLGVLLVASDRPDAMSEGQVEIAAALAGQGMTAYQNAQLFSQVRRLATIDGLTGLYNRRHFFAEANGQFRVARRYGRPIAAIMIDVDYFKRINDAHGHPVGDEVIRVLARRLRATVRDGDVLCRYGGEEFVLLTPETGPAAEQLAERLRQVVNAEPVSTPVGPLSVTISLGVARLREADVDLDQLVARADAALYEAKQNGRNRIAVA